MCKLSILKVLFTGLFTIVCSLPLAAQQFGWAKAWGWDDSIPVNGYPQAEGRAISCDSSGNVYIGGLFAYPTDFDPGPGVYTLYPKGGGDAFVSKLDAEGNFVWAKRMGSNNSGLSEWERVIDMANDKDGNIYVLGCFREDTADFGPYTFVSNGYSDIFICKLDTNGNFVWAKSIGGSTNLDIPGSLSLDSLGNLYIAGHFGGTVDFDPGAGVYPLTPIWWRNSSRPTDTTNSFLLKLSSNGDFMWAYNFPCAGGYVYVNNEQGMVYITGTGDGIVDFDPGANTADVHLTSSNSYIVKFDFSGNFVSAATITTPGIKILGSDDFGNIYFGGMHYGPVSKIDAAYNPLWVRDLDNVRPFNATLTKEGIYVVGCFRGRVDFDPGPDTYYLTTTVEDVFILKLDTAGNFVWAVKAVEAPSVDFGHDVFVDKCNYVYATGSFKGLADFDPGPGVFNLMGKGYEDAFALKLSQRKPPHITVDTFDLGVSESYAYYQWYLNGELISGATDSIYTVTENGDYHVVITSIQGCVDITPVYKVTNVYDETEDSLGLGMERLAVAVCIYPNPTTDFLQVISSVKVYVTLHSIEGKLLQQHHPAGIIDLSGFASGLYLLKIQDKYGRHLKTEKIIKR